METETQELLRLTRENNRMLRSMRRGAFWGGLLKVIIWCAVIFSTVWFYATYLAPVMQSALAAMEQAQQVGGKASAQYNDLQTQLKKIQNQFGGLLPKGQ